MILKVLFFAILLTLHIAVAARWPILDILKPEPSIDRTDYTDISKETLAGKKSQKQVRDFARDILGKGK
ncbi:hypothetical protein MSG28_002485 [Choristoneura fumiferana]|uniref:Uncharacterized protein n=1 Tax=Choristoneura fumiferana TaxID=7141 RepID=A0ACC0JVW7_CHOFU|nr:hypothetical protein MSG28_002485 [Choristoneura fumiferana]